MTPGDADRTVRADSDKRRLCRVPRVYPQKKSDDKAEEAMP